MGRRILTTILCTLLGIACSFSQKLVETDYFSANPKLGGKVAIKKSTTGDWQSATIPDGSRVKLLSGTNIISIIGQSPDVPSVEHIYVSKNNTSIDDSKYKAYRANIECAEDNPINYNLDIDINNFPIIDGSDSTDPLRTILMCKLLGFDYKWERRPFTQEPGADIKMVIPEYTCSESQEQYLRTHCLKQSNTHGSFVNLIDGTVELIIAARSKSRDEALYAEEKGVALIEKPIAKDALAFIVNPHNPINNLTTIQLQGIYTGDITNWKEVGGEDEEIKPYVRNRNSGSQEKFETLVMNGLDIKDFPELQVGQTMMSPYYQIEDDSRGLGYTPFYYYNVIVDNGSTKVIGIDGVEMSKENIRNNSYPYTTEVYAAVRSDINRNSPAFKLFEFLTTPDGQNIINESGYVILDGDLGISSLYDYEDKIISTSYTNLKGSICEKSQRGFLIKTDIYKSGRKTSKKILIK